MPKNTTETKVKNSTKKSTKNTQLKPKKIPPNNSRKRNIKSSKKNVPQIMQNENQSKPPKRPPRKKIPNPKYSFLDQVNALKDQPLPMRSNSSQIFDEFLDGLDSD